MAVSTDIAYRVGQEGVWLLRKDKKRTCYRAGHPQRFQKPDQAKAIRAILAKEPVLSETARATPRRERILGISAWTCPITGARMSRSTA